MTRLFIFHSVVCQEGPTCVIKEEEFFDAVDASLDRLELEAQKEKEREREKIVKPPPTANTPGAMLALKPEHSLYNEVLQSYKHTDSVQSTAPLLGEHGD